MSGLSAVSAVSGAMTVKNEIVSAVSGSAPLSDPPVKESAPSHTSLQEHGWSCFPEGVFVTGIILGGLGILIVVLVKDRFSPEQKWIPIVLGIQAGLLLTLSGIGLFVARDGGSGSIQEQVNRLWQENNTYRTENDRLTRNNAEFEQQVNRLDGSNKTFQAENQRLNEHTLALQAAARRFEEQHAQAKKELEELQALHKTASSNLQVLHNEMAQLTKTGTAMGSVAVDLEHTQKELATEVGELGQGNRDLGATVEAFRLQIAAMRDRDAHVSAENQKLHENVEALAAQVGVLQLAFQKQEAAYQAILTGHKALNQIQSQIRLDVGGLTENTAKITALRDQMTQIAKQLKESADAIQQLPELIRELAAVLAKKLVPRNSPPISNNKPSTVGVLS